MAGLVQHHPIKSKTAICHIRQANIGDICIANTHPFSRELWDGMGICRQQTITKL